MRLFSANRFFNLVVEQILGKNNSCFIYFPSLLYNIFPSFILTTLFTYFRNYGMIVTKEQFVNNIEKPNLQKLYTFLYVLLVIMTNNVVHTLHEG